MRGGNLNSSTEHEHDFNTNAWLPSSGTKAAHVSFAEHMHNAEDSTELLLCGDQSLLCIHVRKLRDSSSIQTLGTTFF